MATFINYTIIIIYCTALIGIFLYSLSMLSLLLNYLKHRKQNDESPKFNLLDPKEIPYVTIQLPLYNEKYVVPRLLENIAKLEYPRTKLEIQVLDDSTDESVAETAEIIKNLQATGLDIQHIRRENRQGFKAGALKEGLAIADRLYLTEIEAIPPHADVFFPEYNDGTWEVETRQERPETADTPAYAYVDYIRKK